ncbi:MAG: phosphatase PAP2 family protein, partial [Ilumatobacteraceae bacterium]
RRAVRALGPVHAALTLAVIVVTANHYLLDAVGGLAVFALARWIAHRIERRSAGSVEKSAAHVAVD